MVDIKELMRTYVFLNDPKVRQVSTKFGAVLLALGVIALGTWAVITYVGPDGAGVADAPTAAETSDDDQAGAEDTTSSDENEACMLEEELEAWKAENPERVADPDFEVQNMGDASVCVSW